MHDATRNVPRRAGFLHGGSRGRAGFASDPVVFDQVLETIVRVEARINGAQAVPDEINGGNRPQP
jgi:hypothetical protein